MSHLRAEVGFRPIDVGPLSFARFLEGMALINLALKARNGLSWATADSSSARSPDRPTDTSADGRRVQR